MIIYGEKRVADDIGSLYDARCGLWKRNMFRCVADSTVVWDFIPDWIDEEVKFFGHVGPYVLRSNEEAYVAWIVGEVDIPEQIIPYTQYEGEEMAVAIYLSKENLYIWDTIYEIIVHSDFLSWGVGFIQLSRYIL